MKVRFSSSPASCCGGDTEIARPAHICLTTACSRRRLARQWAAAGERQRYADGTGIGVNRLQVLRQWRIVDARCGLSRRQCLQLRFDAISTTSRIVDSRSR